MSSFELASTDDVNETFLKENDVIQQDDVNETFLEENDSIQQRQPWRRVLFGSLGVAAVVGLALGLVAAVKPIGIKVGPYTLGTKGYSMVDPSLVSQKYMSTANTKCENGICCSKSTAAPDSCVPACFPGQAEVQMQDQRLVKINQLQAGDRVLVESSSGQLVYEPVLSFLHSGGVGSRSEFLTIKHETGALRVSANHVLFVASAAGRVDKAADQIAEGDELLVVPAGGSDTAALSKVLSVTHEVNDLGVYAPLTWSGKIVVDGTVASNYATIFGMHFGHEASHVAFFPVRAYHKLGLSQLLAPYWGPSTEPEKHEVHPLAVFYLKALLKVTS